MVREVSWIEQAEELERQAVRYREYAGLVAEGKKKIKIDTVIMDKDDNRLMRVKKLRNGSNDFEADSLEGNGVGKGYHFIVSNWEVVES